MALTSGTKLGPYEIVAPLGAGGMGEVYRARDTRLDRTVAIKLLPAQYSADPLRKQRFEREAKVISNLNHPNICVLHDVGHQDGIDYLVMECVEGETLANRLRRGPLAPEQVLKYGAEIAGALEKAHRNGVIHRDLKPSNIMLTKAGVKLLDFGLAKVFSEGFVGDRTLSASPKGCGSLTAEGSFIGTLQYMSPEQLEGKEADARSDVFAFGAVLYEMATGRPAFEGKSQASVIAAILEHDPHPISAFQPLAPLALDRLIRTCLAKDPDDRIQTAHDVKLQLQWIAESGMKAGEVARVSGGHGKWQRASWLLTVAFFLLAATLSVLLWNTGNKRALPMYFRTALPFAASEMALSPDGHTLAMVAYSEQANNYALWMYEVGGRRTTSLDGTQGASYPFWSPDGKFIGFFAGGKLKKVEKSGGHPQVLCDAPNGRGGTWNRGGVILFTPEGIGGVFRVSSSGGSPVEVTKPDTSRNETSNRWPMFLPDGKHFLYLGVNFSGQLEDNAIFLGSLDSQERRLLVSTSANAAYAEPGYLLYLRDNKTLVAQSFDLRRFVLTGEPHTLSDEVMYFPSVERAIFSVSGGEVLITQTGKGAFVSRLTWFDRSGKPAGTVGMPGSYKNVRLSPDGRRVVVDQTDEDGRTVNIWILEPARGATTRLTFDPSAHQAPVWSPDGRQIMYTSNRTLSMRLFLKNADGTGAEAEVAGYENLSQTNVWDWSRDGKYVLVRRGKELWYITWPEQVAKPLLQTKWTVRNAQLSPDGRWLAYASNETGSMEVYVSPFLNGNGKWQVSSGGGEEPKWRHDGKELFYVGADGKMMAAAVTAGASFEASSPAALFQTHRRQPVSGQDVFSYDVSTDGQRFLIITKVDEANAAPPSVLLNWASQIEK